MKPRYTLNAGRLIERDGAPFATIHGAGQYDPVELDQFARDVAVMANYFARLKEAARQCSAPGITPAEIRARVLLAEIAAFDPYKAAP